jgi:hypothetical protein
VNATTKARFAQGVYKTPDVSKVPQTLIDFYDECARAYYAITSNKDFNVGERGIIAAMEQQIHKRDLRIDELEARIKALESPATQTVADDAVECVVKRGPGRPRTISLGA